MLGPGRADLERLLSPAGVIAAGEAGRTPGRAPPGEITGFTSVGWPGKDAAPVGFAYDQARVQVIGTEVQL